jgi:putative flippase GtrA
MNRSLGVQFNRFLLGGALAVGLDWGTYLMLAEFSGLNASISKFYSFLLGAIFAFFFNGRITFQVKLSAPRLIRHMSLYTLSIIANVTAFRFFQGLNLTSANLGTFVSLIIATSISMSLNFLGMRYFVFSKPKGQRNARS